MRNQILAARALHVFGAVLIMVVSASACVHRPPAGQAIGAHEWMGPRLERIGRHGVTVSVARPAYVALVEHSPQRVRLVYPGAGDRFSRLSPGTHRLRFGGEDRLALGPPAPSSMRIEKVCFQDPDRERPRRSTECGHQLVGQPAGARDGYRHLVAFVSDQPLTPEQIAAALPQIDPGVGPEAVARDLAGELGYGGDPTLWAAYISEPY